jgi:hypothetical protein
MGKAMLAGLLIAVSGCGADEDGSGAEPQSSGGPTAESPAADTPTGTTERQSAPARSDRECLELWNSQVAPGTVGQKSPSDFVADIASKHTVKACAQYVDGDCLVVVPFKPGASAAWGFVALNGRAPYNHPGQIRLKPGEAFATNAQTRPDGTLE